MATGTSVRIANGRQQFQHLFEEVKVVRFTLDVGSISANSTDESSVSVPGVDVNWVVLGVAHGQDAAHALLHEVHTATDALHVNTHNNSGGAVNPASTDWTVVLGKVIAS